MSNMNELNKKKRQVHEMLAQALNHEDGEYRPLYKIDFEGMMHGVASDGQYYPVELASSADLKNQTISLYLSLTDQYGKRTTKELSLGEGVLNLFMEYNTLLYKQAILNERAREEYNRHSQWA